MEENEASQQHDESTPIFEAYRRGYEPEQVDRFVADQQRRLDETLTRATEAERRLAAAVGQLRELHRRVTTLEGEGRSTSVPSLDTVGERVQRILQEAWDGAHAIRQGAEKEALEIRQRTLTQAQEVVASARRKAQAIEEDIEKRKRAYLGRIEEERPRAITQIGELHEQRKASLDELVQMRDAIEATVLRAMPKPRTQPAPESKAPASPASSHDSRPMATPDRRQGTSQFSAPRTVKDVAPRTMPVYNLNETTPKTEPPDPGELVRSHRATVVDEAPNAATIRPISHRRPRAPRTSVFDFDEE